LASVDGLSDKHGEDSMLAGWLAAIGFFHGYFERIYNFTRFNALYAWSPRRGATRVAMAFLTSPRSGGFTAFYEAVTASCHVLTHWNLGAQTSVNGSLFFVDMAEQGEAMRGG